MRPLCADGSLVVSVREVPPEPDPDRTGTAYVLTVHGGDRPGIVSAVTRVLAQANGNITDLTTRLTGDLYVLVAEVDLPAGVDEATLAARLAATGRDLGVGVTSASAGHRRPVSLVDWTEHDLGVRGEILPVVRAPHSVLAQPAEPVDPTDPKVVQLAADLVATMRVSPGCVGLAAPQVDVGQHVFCVDVSAHPRARTTHGTFVFCNAEIVQATRREFGAGGLHVRPRPHR